MADSVEDDVRRAPPLCFLHGVLPLLLSLAADSTLLWMWHIGALSLPVQMLLHPFAAALTVISIGACKRDGLDERLPWLAFLTVLFLGPLGALGMLWAVLMYWRFQRRATPFDVWYRTILPEQDVSRSEALVQRLRAWGQREEQSRQPVPFPEIMQGGTRADKQLAIALMSRNFNAAFAPAFKQALADEDNAVRVQAASAITHIEEQFLKASLRLERDVKRHPRNAAAWFALARHYDDQANAGLADEDAINAARSKAVDAYQQALVIDPVNFDAVWALGRLRVRIGDVEAAIQDFELAFATRPTVSMNQRVWYWESLYRANRFAVLRNDVRTHFGNRNERLGLSPAVLDSVALWAGEVPQVEVRSGGVA
ncbi:MAG: hypothetical protein H6981_08610 [Gammaproteobacteria bacterium]|nr:hypothetical protein [Gammaproteobacteria bacterium]MCP5136849.1 hypothetical protein [Gammaproteobacteria bacterium]